MGDAPEEVELRAGVVQLLNDEDPSGAPGSSRALAEERLNYGGIDAGVGGTRFLSLGTRDLPAVTGGGATCFARPVALASTVEVDFAVGTGVGGDSSRDVECGGAERAACNSASDRIAEHTVKRPNIVSVATSIGQRRSRTRGGPRSRWFICPHSRRELAPEMDSRR